MRQMMRHFGAASTTSSSASCMCVLQTAVHHHPLPRRRSTCTAPCRAAPRRAAAALRSTMPCRAAPHCTASCRAVLPQHCTAPCRAVLPLRHVAQHHAEVCCHRTMLCCGCAVWSARLYACMCFAQAKTSVVNTFVPIRQKCKRS